MTKQSLFHSTDAENIRRKVSQLISENQQELLSPRTLQSPRAVGDAIQELIADNFEEITREYCSEYSSDFARRSMADLAFVDRSGNYHVVDVKTHRADTRFNMPNLTSVERLARFYENDEHFFSILMIKYLVTEQSLKVSDVTFVPIESLDWSCLTIGALGWGQIQIANSNNIVANESYDRKEWMIELCDTLLEFYPKEIAKISDRIKRFEEVKSYWENKPS